MITACAAARIARLNQQVVSRGMVDWACRGQATSAEGGQGPLRFLRLQRWQVGAHARLSYACIVTRTRVFLEQIYESPVALRNWGDIMPELRKGPVRNQWVIVAPERAKRPSDYLPSRVDKPEVQDLSNCPFCPGNESMTPSEVYRVDANDGTWRIRVVPNRFPILQKYDDLARVSFEGLFARMNGLGAHEVVIETPDHNRDLPDLSEDQVKHVVDAYVSRLLTLMENPDHQYVLLFKNHGDQAGASLLHPHSQIIATPIVPQAVRDALARGRSHFARNHRCLFCDVLLSEQRSGDRIVEEADGFVVWAPYDSRFPFELLICPRTHAHDFATLRDDQRRGFARILKRTLGRLKALLGDVPYNFVLQNSPNPPPHARRTEYSTTLRYDYHWRLEIIPRLTTVAGFEWGTGFYINPMPPEQAAAYLREIREDQL